MDVHVFYGGQSYDLDSGLLDLGELSSDNEIRNAVARHFSVPESKLANFHVDRVGNDVTLRPQASFGNE